MIPEVQTIDCVPGQIMYNCSYIGAMFFWGPMPYPPPPFITVPWPAPCLL